MTVSQILQEARLKIAAGWVQAVEKTWFPDDIPRYCLVGALRSTVPATEAGLGYQAALVLAHCTAYERPCFGPLDSLVLFNDQPGRTQAEVLALIDAALTEVTK